VTTRVLRTLVLADEANVVASLRGVDRRADWLLLRDHVADPGRGRALIEFVLYAGLPPNIDAYDYPRQRQRKEAFLQWAEHNGFLVVRKDGSPTEDGRYRANVDVLLAIDAVALALEMRPDVVVLMTGDADFAHLALTLRRRGIRVEVAALAQSLGARLRAAANGVIDLAELLDQLPPLRDGPGFGGRLPPVPDE
jgi:uncharacterized LabA/DUF88 family protein